MVFSVFEGMIIGGFRVYLGEETRSSGIVDWGSLDTDRICSLSTWGHLEPLKLEREGLGLRVSQGKAPVFPVSLALSCHAAHPGRSAFSELRAAGPQRE